MWNTLIKFILFTYIFLIIIIIIIVIIIIIIIIKHDNIIDLLMKIMDRIIFKTTKRCLKWLYP